jgi:hypothetical protein
VNPWEVSAGKGGIDYDKLVDQFGCQRLDAALVDRVARLTGRPPHVFLRRGLFFAHRYRGTSKNTFFFPIFLFGEEVVLTNFCVLLFFFLLSGILATYWICMRRGRSSTCTRGGAPRPRRCTSATSSPSCSPSKHRPQPQTLAISSSVLFLIHGCVAYFVSKGVLCDVSSLEDSTILVY